MFISQSLLLTNQGEIIINFLEIEIFVFFGYCIEIFLSVAL